ALGAIAERGPGVAAVRALPEHVGASVDRARVVRRDDDRRLPVGRRHRVAESLFRRVDVAPGRPVATAGNRAGRIAGTDAAFLAGHGVDAREPEELRRRVERDVVGGINDVVEAVAAAPLDPVGVGDAFAAVGRGGTRPRAVVLQATVDVVRLLQIEADAIE